MRRSCGGKVTLIEGYLLPLKLADEQYPVEEHARMAAEVIRRGAAAGGAA